MEKTEVETGCLMEAMVKDNPERFVQWYRDHDYQVEWEGDQIGSYFPDDGTLNIINPVLDRIIAEEWKHDFGTVCNWYCSRILGYLRDKGYTIHGIKNGKYTAICALALAESIEGASKEGA